MTKQESEAIGYILWTETFKGQPAAAAAYRKYFGVSVKDKSLTKQLWSELTNGYFAGDTKIAIPIKLAVAIALRFSARQRVPAVAWGARHIMLETAERLWAEYTAQNKAKPKGERLLKGEVKRNAAQAAHDKYGGRAGVTVNALLVEMGRKQRRW